MADHTLDEAEFLRRLMQLRGDRPFFTHDDIRDAFKATVPHLIRAIISERCTEARLDMMIERDFCPGLQVWLESQGLQVIRSTDDMDLGSDNPRRSTP